VASTESSYLIDSESLGLEQGQKTTPNIGIIHYLEYGFPHLECLDHELLAGIILSRCLSAQRFD
jgi:hypothetical protein